MEAALVSGVLNSLSIKLAALLIKEYSSIVGARKDLQELQDLVEEINNWLETSGYEVKRNDSSFNWIKKLKNVVNEVDDVVDEFQLNAEEHDVCGDVGIVSKYLFTKLNSFIFRYKAASKIKKIKERFAVIVKERADFSAIANSLSFDHPVLHTNKTIVEMPSWPTVNAESILGRDNEKNHVISKLLEADEHQNVKIVSIVGLGGSGKTALAKLITNDDSVIKQHFKERLWVHVSREFDVQKLVEKLFDAFSDSKSEHHPLQHMIDKVSDKLAEKRFLLVLDNAWMEDEILWEEFMVHLKSGAPGSRILLTTLNGNVAEAVKSAYIFNLPSLSMADSWRVFEQSYGTAARGLDPNFILVGKAIVNNCGGVPLAIKVLAGFLRDKKRIEEWQAVRASNFLYTGIKEHHVFDCLKLSYFNLPSHLKQCFTICSVFPKGYRIDREQLIDLWIVHDMITPVDGVDYLEYSGNQYFSSLVSMSFLQDVDEKDDGRVECVMHDLVHDFARSILGDELAVSVPKETTDYTKSFRYFSIIEQSRNIAPKNIFEKARAIYVASGDGFVFDEALKNAKHLRSIIVNYAVTKLLPTPILQVNNLKYLSISGLKFETLPEAIADIWSLQFLRVNSLSLLELPRSIGKLKKLRTLNLSGCAELMILPDSIGDCHMMSSLDLHYCEKLTELPNSISNIKNLRVLRLGLSKIERLPQGITTLGNLECLDLWLCQMLAELPEGIKNLKKLEVLNLDGCDGLRSMPAGIGQLSRLQKLGLFVVGEHRSCAKISELRNIGKIGGELTIRSTAYRMRKDEAYQACLKEKTNLQKLTLIWDINGGGASNGESPEFVVDDEGELAVLDGLEPPSGIKSLEIEQYFGLECARWMLKQVGGGVGLNRFPCLTVMRLRCFGNLKHLKDLVGLPCLVELELSDMPFLESVSGGPFPSLVKLVVKRLLKLGRVGMMTQRTMAAWNVKQESLQIGTSVSYLHIEDCPEFLVSLPSSLEHLRLRRSHNLMLLMAVQCTSLRSLSINGFRLYLPIQFEKLCHLQEMEISNLDGPGSHLLLGHLTSLQVLRIAGCYGLYQLPKCLGELRSLRKLEISGSCLTCFPESMGHLVSLEELHIGYCPGLKFIPKWIKDLSNLRRLQISQCPHLDRRCQRGTGEDWHLISHIPHLRIG